ncbi:hypothetical protein DYB38_005316 [Aphanomyces astaci]|uniref:Uncharacterized protein n=1 Tax=Aphanomyces astaci TaxID=112090 RepID=A0A397D028_APHAT|nr:hypothetical protein DYB38_005316 [Aphanomyces astaci]
MLRVHFQSGNYDDAACPTLRQVQESINYVRTKELYHKVLCRLLKKRCNIGICQPPKNIKKSITHSYSAWKKLMASLARVDLGDLMEVVCDKWVTSRGLRKFRRYFFSQWLPYNRAYGGPDDRTYSPYSTNPLDSLIRQVVYLYTELQLLMDKTDYGNSLVHFLFFPHPAWPILTLKPPTQRAILAGDPKRSHIVADYWLKQSVRFRSDVLSVPHPSEPGSVVYTHDLGATVAYVATLTAHPAVQCKLKKLTEPYPFVSVQFADDKLGHSWTNGVVAPATTYTWDGETAKEAVWNQSPLRAAKAAKVITIDSGDDDKNDTHDPDYSENEALSDQLDTKIDAELQDTDE